MPQRSTDIPDVQKLTHTSSTERDNIKYSFARRKVTQFLYKYSPALATDDVINNNSFVEAFSRSVSEINVFFDAHDRYLQGKKRHGKKTDLSNAIDAIITLFKQLEAKMNDAALIKIDVASGLQQLSVCVAAKNTALCTITTLASEVEHSIKINEGSIKNR